jgi:thiol-disulfide isomerase/thioredoxin
MIRKTFILSLLLFAMFSNIKAQEVGSSAPELTGIDASGRRHTLSSYRGKVVLLKFFASWCGPCRRSMPKTIALQRKYASRGFMVFSVGMNNDTEADRRFLSENGYNFSVMVFRTGLNYSGYNFRGIPFEVLIDRNGKILWKGHWGLNESLIKSALNNAQLNPPDSPAAQVPERLGERSSDEEK